MARVGQERRAGGTGPGVRERAQVRNRGGRVAGWEVVAHDVGKAGGVERIAGGDGDPPAVAAWVLGQVDALPQSRARGAELEVAILGRGVHRQAHQAVVEVRVGAHQGHGGRHHLAGAGSGLPAVDVAGGTLGGELDSGRARGSLVRDAVARGEQVPLVAHQPARAVERAADEEPGDGPRAGVDLRLRDGVAGGLAGVIRGADRGRVARQEEAVVRGARGRSGERRGQRGGEVPRPPYGGHVPKQAVQVLTSPVSKPSANSAVPAVTKSL